MPRHIAENTPAGSGTALTIISNTANVSGNTGIIFENENEIIGNNQVNPTLTFPFAWKNGADNLILVDSQTNLFGTGDNMLLHGLSLANEGLSYALARSGVFTVDFANFMGLGNRGWTAFAEYSTGNGIFVNADATGVGSRHITIGNSSFDNTGDDSQASWLMLAGQRTIVSRRSDYNNPTLELQNNGINTTDILGTASTWNISVSGDFAGDTLDISGHAAFGNSGAIDTDIFGGGVADVTAVFDETKTNFTNPVYGITNNVRLQAGANTTQDARGSVLQIAAADNFNYSGLLVGGHSIFRHEGTGVVSMGIGHAGLSDNTTTGILDVGVGSNGEIDNSSTGTINFGVGVRGAISNSSTGIISEAATFLADVPTNMGTITNLYGLLIEDHSGIGVTISENLHSSGVASLNVFEGRVDAGTYSVGGVAGATGTFTTVDLKTVTVTSGLIVSIV